MDCNDWFTDLDKSEIYIVEHGMDKLIKTDILHCTYFISWIQSTWNRFQFVANDYDAMYDAEQQLIEINNYWNNL